MAASVKWSLFGVVVFLLFHCYPIHGRNNVVLLDEDNWEQMLQNEWMIEFYAPWCPACRALQPIWTEYAGWSEELGIKVGQVDVTTSPGLSGRFVVTALPTIYHVLNGEFRQYHGSRDKDALMSFVEHRKWEKVDPVPSWKSPASFHMGAAAYFFKLSQTLRGVHNKLMEDYGLPTWGSYVIFAIATIFIGALLGLLLVCLIDYFYPPTGLELRYRYTERATHVGAIKDDDEDYDPSKDDLVDEENSQESSQDERYSRSSQLSTDNEEEEQEVGDGKDSSAPSTPGTPGKARQRKPRKAD